MTSMKKILLYGLPALIAMAGIYFINKQWGNG